MFRGDGRPVFRSLISAIVLSPLILTSEGLARSSVPAQDLMAPSGHEFYFTRAIFSGPLKQGLSNGVMITIPAWAADHPKSDEQLLTIIDRLIERVPKF